jgi:hypothetical protein
VKALWCASVDNPFAAAPWALAETRPGAVAVETLSVAPTAEPRPGLVILREGAVSQSSSAHAANAIAGCRTDRDGEAIRQAARLAAWEDEGGMASS